MSRVGNMPITVPAGVEVKLEGNHITVKGPKGSLERDLHPNIKVELDGNEIKVSRPDDTNLNKSLHGTTRALIHNMVEGVVNEFKVELEINGVGYRAQKQGNKLVMNLGYSHPVEMEAPAGITFDLTDANHIVVRGIDKELVGQTANEVRAKRPPEVYRGKGIKYATQNKYLNLMNTLDLIEKASKPINIMKKV